MDFLRVLRLALLSCSGLVPLNTWAIPVDLLPLTFTQVLSAGISTPSTPTSVDQDFGVGSSYSAAVSTGGSGQASADLTTGTLKTEALSSISSPLTSQSLVNSFAHAYDILHFATPTTVTYQLNIEGSLGLGSEGTFARNSASLFVFNVSDVGQIYADAPSGFISVVDVLTDETWSNAIFSASAFRDDANTTPGTTVDIDETISASLEVVPSDFYLFFLYQTSFTNASGSDTTFADFYSTATFRFTDLGGTTFESASGLLPGSSGRIELASVPAPTSAWLLLPGLGMLALRLRRGARPVLAEPVGVVRRS